MEAAAAGGSKALPPTPPPTPPPGSAPPASPYGWSSVVPSGFSLQRRQAGAATEALGGAGKELWLMQLPEAKQLDLASLLGVKLAVADGAPDGCLGSILLPNGARYSLQSEPCSNANELLAVVPRGDEVAASVRRIARRVTLVQVLEPPAQPAAVVAPASASRAASSTADADFGTSNKKSRKEEKDKSRRHVEQPPAPVPAPVLLKSDSGVAGQTAAGLAGAEIEGKEMRSKQKKEKKKKEKETQEEKRGEAKVVQPLARPASVPAVPASGKVGEHLISMQSTEPTVGQGDVKEEKDEKRKKKKKKEEGEKEEVKQAEGKLAQPVPAPAHRKDVGAAEKEVVELVHTAAQAPRKEKKRAKRDAELLTAPVPAVTAAAGAGADDGARHELANSSAGLKEDAAQTEGKRKKEKKAEAQLLPSGLAATVANETTEKDVEGVGVRNRTKLPAGGTAKQGRRKVRRGGEEGGPRTTSS